MTEEALVRVKWLHRLVDMVHAGCLPQVQKYKYWRIFWYKSTNTDKLPSAACARHAGAQFCALTGTQVQILTGCLPQLVLDTLVRKLRGALNVETEAELVLHYLEFLARHAPKHTAAGGGEARTEEAAVTKGEFARDVAALVLRRRVLLQHLSTLPGATSLLIRVLLASALARSGYSSAQFTCFASTKVQTLTQVCVHRPQRRQRRGRGRGRERCTGSREAGGGTQGGGHCGCGCSSGGGGGGAAGGAAGAVSGGSAAPECEQRGFIVLL